MLILIDLTGLGLGFIFFVSFSIALTRAGFQADKMEDEITDIMQDKVLENTL